MKTVPWRTPIAIYRRSILALMFFTGICSIGYEVLLERSVVVLIGSSSVTMGIIISTFILGYLSSYFFGKLADRIESKTRLVKYLAILECLICLALVLVIPVTRYSLVIADYMSYLIFLYYLDFYYVLLITIGLIALIVPLLMGAEIPIAMKLMAWSGAEEGESTFDTVGKLSGAIFTFDSLGAGCGGMVTALVFIPYLGRTYTSLLLGLLTLSSGMAFLFVHIRYSSEKGRAPKPSSKRRTGTRPERIEGKHHHNVPVAVAIAVLVGLMVILANMSGVEEASFRRFYGGNILHHSDSRYQEIVITEREPEGITLYLNGQLQISELDDHMYHEFLVHPALVAHPDPKRVLVIGGGDGGAVWEILKHDTVEKVVFIELDREVVEVCNRYMETINHHCFDDPRVEIKYVDGRIFLRDHKGEGFDVVVGDLPDPDTEAVSMLYTVEFFRDVRKVLDDDGIFVLQSASWFEYPYITISIEKTLKEVFPHVELYLSNVWTFGPWSFALASEGKTVGNISPEHIERTLRERDADTLYYNNYTHRASFLMADNPYLRSGEGRAKISTIDRPVLQNPWE